MSKGAALIHREIEKIGGHEILVPEDLGDLRKAEQAIFELMRDGAFHSRGEIERASGYQAEALRRMRSLRQWFVIERRKSEPTEFAPTRVFEYRLRNRPEVMEPEQGKLI